MEPGQGQISSSSGAVLDQDWIGIGSWCSRWAKELGLTPETWSRLCFRKRAPGDLEETATSRLPACSLQVLLVLLGCLRRAPTGSNSSSGTTADWLTVLQGGGSSKATPTPLRSHYL